jgi:hypothetical protein
MDEREHLSNDPQPGTGRLAAQPRGDLSHRAAAFAGSDGCNWKAEIPDRMPPHPAHYAQALANAIERARTAYNLALPFLGSSAWDGRSARL